MEHIIQKSDKSQCPLLIYLAFYDNARSNKVELKLVES